MTFTKVQSGFVDLTTSSGLTVGAGSASTPALNFSDNSTGFFRSGSNEIAISLSGSQKFTFKNNNFGIGTNSPDVPLTVVGNTKISGNTHIGGASGSGARLSVYRATQYAGNPVFEAYSNLTGNAQTKIFEVDGDGSILVNGGTGVATAGTIELRQRGETKDDGIAITSSHAASHRIWKNSAGRLNIGVNADSDQIFITQAAAPNGYIGLNKPTRFGAGDGGPADYGSVGSGNIDTDVTQQVWYTGGGRHYIQLDVNANNNEGGAQDPAYIAWKGSVSSSPNTVIPNGGYMARIGGYRDLINNGSTSLCWESVHNVSADPHLPTRNLTLRYDGRIGFGAEIEPACVVDMSQDTTAICLPKGTTSQRSDFTNEAGQMRFNTNSQVIEWYNGNSWKDITEGAITSTSGDYVTTSSGFKYHFFNQSGSFVNSGGAQVAEVYVIGGGGGGGGGTNNAGSGGGGGGGMVYGTVSIPNGTYTVTVGGAGAASATSTGNNSSANGSAGGTSSIVIGNTTFQATGGGGGGSDAASTSPGGLGSAGQAQNGSGAAASFGGAGGTGTINGGTSYTGPDGTASVFGTGGAGGFGGSLDSSDRGQNNTAGSNGTNGGAGGGGGGQNNGPHNGNGGDGSTTYYTGGGGGGAYDNDGNPSQYPTPANSLDGGTGYFNGGDGGDMQGTQGQTGGKPTGSPATNYSGGGTTAGTTRFNNGGGGGAYGGGGGGAADANNSQDASGGDGGSGVVIIKYSV